MWLNNVARKVPYYYKERVKHANKVSKTELNLLNAAAPLFSAPFAPLQKPFLSKRIKHTKKAGEVKVHRLVRFDILKIIV